MLVKDYYKARRSYTLHRVGGLVVFIAFAFLMAYLAGGV